MSIRATVDADDDHEPEYIPPPREDDRGHLTTGSDAERLREALETAARLHAAGQARAATVRAYDGDWRRFTAWCGRYSVAACPAVEATVIAYVGHLVNAGKSPATIRRAVAAISRIHRDRGHNSPCTGDHLQQMRRGLADDVDAARRARGGASPLIGADVRAMVDTCDARTIRGQRDRAIVLLTYAGGFRRSEVAALQVDDLRFESRGVVVTLRRTKTTTAEQARQVSIPKSRHKDTCPRNALRAWLDTARIESGPVFRGIDRWGRGAREALSDRGICRVVQHVADAAGIDGERVSAHSLRAGHVTQRRITGDDTSAIRDTTGHRTEVMVNHYDRGARMFRGDVAGSLGL